ncbi:hypothetical protein IPZ58_09560 [Streptomyces roseoverticillatus]|uniref:hypothetical protein n=1 Tax=Streptomyces roseoverticillatus TaxID=66429 RepID=UPI001F240F17|nr:hypothetical protein [Streptomyces roseoverticillatus]MCF3101828.1 hypothetical protein [Streptomyces roseoverticillatus]
MTAPTTLRGGFVFLDPEQGRVLRVAPFQYNPDTLTRTIQPRGVGEDAGDRLEALRLKGPPRESFRFDAEFDALDQSGAGRREATRQDGLSATLAALETAVYPASAQLLHERGLADLGMIEIAPVEAPLPVLVLGTRRVLPVRITEFTVTEEAYDSDLNPIRAKIGVSVRTLTTDDVASGHKAGALYLRYHQEKERLAGLTGNGPGAVGLTGV